MRRKCYRCHKRQATAGYKSCEPCRAARRKQQRDRDGRTASQTELAHLRRIKNKAKACVKASKRIFGLECSDTEMKVPPHLMDALAREIEKYEKSAKKSAKKSVGQPERALGDGCWGRITAETP